MKTIKLSRKDYNGSPCIFINCEPDPIFDRMIRSFPGRKWSQSNRGWYIEDREERFRELRLLFSKHFIIDTSGLIMQKHLSKSTTGRDKAYPGRYGPVEIRLGSEGSRMVIKFLGRYDSAWIEELRQYGKPYYERNKREWYLISSKLTIDSLTEYFSVIGVELRVKKEELPVKITKQREEIGKEVRLRKLSDDSQEAVSLLESHLLEMRFSNNTINTYIHQLEFFLKYFNTMKPLEISLEDISQFMNDYVIKLNFSTSYQNQMITTLKTTYGLMGKTALDFEEIKRPRMGRPLPQVFSKEEVTRILNSPRNIKHKLILWMIYSCGLRRSEVINIKLEDINFDRGTIHIRSAKGNVDRVVPVPESVSLKAREYLESYHPKEYLFEGQSGGRYSAGSVYRVFKNALQNVGIRKEVGVHSLRHSYATHLHESGLDIRYIQELLGHKSSKTTEIYTHVSRRNLMDIRSPIDDLDLH